MRAAILTFVRAVFWGCVAGGGPFLLITIPVAITEGSLPLLGMTIWIAILPLVFASTIVLPASVFLGLPLTAVLAWMNAERARTYALAGLGLGAVLPVGIASYEGIGWDVSAVILAVLGAAAGTTTAAIWGQWREDLANPTEQPPELD